MRILLTNDDGIDAPGLAALAQAAAPMGQLACVAPRDHHSGCSHRLTTDVPLRLERRAPEHWALHGTPADCVRVALAHLAPHVDWVLSGINDGANLGADVYVSGTVAAVREGVLHGRPGIALSHYRKRGLELDWSRAVRWLQAVLQDLLQRPYQPGAFWNVNLPHLRPEDADPPIVHCPLDPGPLPNVYHLDGDHLRYAGNYHQRPRQAGSDVDVCFAGQIAVSLIRL